MKYDFDKVTDRKGTYAVKWDQVPKPAPSDALPLWVADMDFPCAQPIVDALNKRVDHLIYGYTLYDNLDLKSAVTNWFKKRYDWVVDKDDIFFSPGIVPAVAFLINILTDAGDGIVIQPPVYHPFKMKIENNNRRTVDNPLIYDNGYYTIDYKGLDELLSVPNNKGLIFCNPHNPGGRAWKEEEITKVIEIAEKHNKWIISDEIHADILRKGVKFTPVEKLAGDYKNQIFTCTAPSKTFNTAGIKMSNIVINSKEIQDKYLNFTSKELSVYDVSPFAITAAIAAYTEGEDWLSQVNDYIEDNINLCMEFFKKELPKSVPTYPEATYLFWVDLSKYCDDKDKLEELLSVKAKVALNQGYMFGAGGEGFVRINVACPKSVLVECLNRIKAVLLG